MLPDRIELSTSPLPRENESKQDQGLKPSDRQFTRVLHGLRVLVCGGRDFAVTESEKLWMLRELAGLNMSRRWQFDLIIEGGAPGADAGARIFGDLAGIPVQTYRANWLKHGRAAGPIRNQRMIDEGKPDLVVAFPGGRGTADMVRRARAAGIEVIEVPHPHTEQEKR